MFGKIKLYLIHSHDSLLATGRRVGNKVHSKVAVWIGCECGEIRPRVRGNIICRPHDFGSARPRGELVVILIILKALFEFQII